VGVDLHDVHVHEFLIGECLTCDDISDIDDARLRRISIIIKEDVLGVIISLVDQHHFGSVVRIPRCFVSREVFLYCHNRVLFESLENGLVDF
jgi:hypothetical protein